MKSIPSSRHFNNRLDRLDEQIRDCLSNIRQHLHELETMVHRPNATSTLAPPPHKTNTPAINSQ